MGLNALQVLRAPAVVGSYLSRCTVSCAFALIVTWQRALRSVVSSSSETGATSPSSYMCMHSVSLARASCMSSIFSISWIMHCAEIFWLCKFFLILRMHACASASSQCVPGTTCCLRTVGGVTGIEADEKAALVNKSAGMVALAASGAVLRGVSTSSSPSSFSSSPASSQLRWASAHWNGALSATMHVLGNSRHFCHETHSAQFSSTSASIVVWFSFFLLLFSGARHCRCAHNPPCCQNPAAFSLLSSVPLHSHLGQASVRKRSLASMLLPKVWGFCRAGRPHCDSTMTSAIHPLISSPEPPKPHTSVVIDTRCRFPKFQMFESRWPPAPRPPRGGEPSHWKR